MQSKPNVIDKLVRDVKAGLLKYVSFVPEGANHLAIVEEIFQSSAVFSKIVFPAEYNYTEFLSQYNIKDYGNVVTAEDGKVEVLSSTFVYKPDDLAHTTEDGIVFYTSNEVLHLVTDNKQDIREVLESMEMFSVNPKMLDLIVNSDVEYWPEAFSQYNLFEALSSTVSYLAQNGRTDLITGTVERFNQLNALHTAHLESIQANTAEELNQETVEEVMEAAESSEAVQENQELVSMQAQLDEMKVLIEQQDTAFKASMVATTELKEKNEKLEASLEETNTRLSQYNSFLEKTIKTSSESFAGKEARKETQITSNIIKLI